MMAHLKSHPTDAAGHIGLARIDDALGQVDSAARQYAVAMKLLKNPEPDHFVECADLLVRAGKDEDALAILDKAPVLPVIVDRAVNIEVRRGHFDAALLRTDALLAISTCKEPLMAKKATLLARAGRTGESILVWKAIIAGIGAMPPQAQDSHAMSRLMIQSRQAILALGNGVAPPSP